MKSERSIRRFLEERGFHRERSFSLQDDPSYCYVRDDPVYGDVFYSHGAFRWCSCQLDCFRMFLFEAGGGVEEAYRRLEEGIRTVLGEGYAPTAADRRLLEEKGFEAKGTTVWSRGSLGQETVSFNGGWCRGAETVSFNGGWRIECHQSHWDFFHVRLEDALLALEGE